MGRPGAVVEAGPDGPRQIDQPSAATPIEASSTVAKPGWAWLFRRSGFSRAPLGILHPKQYLKTQKEHTQPMLRQLLILLLIALFTITSIACNQASASSPDQEKPAVPGVVEAAAVPVEVENNESLYAVNEALAQVKKMAAKRAEFSAEIERVAPESGAVHADLPKDVVVTDVFGYQDTGGFFSYYHLGRISLFPVSLLFMAFKPQVMM
jgi:hypothetical protein